jgi:HAE1 family hydrophobic/amphiphilic exporter-1
LDKSIAYNLFGGITLPIFNQRQLKTQYEIAKADYGIAFVDYEKAVINAYNEVSNVVMTQEAIVKRRSFVDEHVQALNLSIEAAQELFIAGRVTSLDVVTAQKESLEAQIGKVELEKENTLNQILLYKALGGGWK